VTTSSSSTISARLRALRAELIRSRLDALIVTHLPHVRYLSGFSGSNALCVITKTDQSFLSDGRYRVQAKDEVRGFRIVIAQGRLFDVAAERALLPKKGRVGFASQHLTVAELRHLKKLFRHARFVPADGIVDRLAAVKRQDEIGLITQAVKITDEVFGKILKILKPGVTELDVAAEIGYLHRTLGAEADAFEPIVASGKRGALPHARASQKKIKNGELVTIDMGCRFRGYHSDLTRTVAVGKPSSRARKIYQIVLDAQRLALDAAGSGMSGRALDAVARTYIKKKGFGKYFSHSLGHGLGLRVHELPRLSKLSVDRLVAGNVVTIEPGIYIPGFGGVRIEDDVVIREGYAVVLNKAPKELIIL
jgi:Xaa-Pro aminopeptidase